MQKAGATGQEREKREETKSIKPGATQAPDPDHEITRQAGQSAELDW
jgi:hypothetical protein